MEVLITIFNEVDPSKKEELVNKFLLLLNDVENPDSDVFMDSINLVTLVKDILVSIKQCLDSLKENDLYRWEIGQQQSSFQVPEYNIHR